MPGDVDVGIERGERARARLDRGFADIRRRVEHLALEIRHVDDVGVHQPDGADPGRGQIERGRRAQAPGPDQQDLGPQQLALSLLARARRSGRRALRRRAGAAPRPAPAPISIRASASGPLTRFGGQFITGATIDVNGGYVMV
jgi:hypothetical protein